MAGRFSFSVPERRHTGDPWFRIGQIDVTTTVLVVILCVVSMFVWAADPGTLRFLVLIPDDVRGGQLWKLATWPLANEPDIWRAFTIAIFWYFGREIEGLLGRNRFAVLLLALAMIPGAVATLVDVPGLAGLELVELGVFLVFIAEYPFARFFFGVAAWTIGAIVVGIQVLQYLGRREEELLLVLLVTIATAGITARTMGLAQSLPWIPALPIGPGASGRSKRSRPARRGRSGGDVVAGPWSSSGRGGPQPLPQPPTSAADAADHAELDALLDKISERGMDGLTGDEKRRLNELSKRMRKR